MITKIITDDCINHLTKTKNKYDLIIADPPYNIGIDYGFGEKADKLSPEQYVEWCEKWIFACTNKLSDNGSFWIISGQEFGAHIDIILQKSGLHIRNRITWYETFGTYCHKKFARTSRPIFYAVKNPKNFTFNKDAVLVPSARQIKYKDKRASSKGKIMDDVWQISRVCGTFNERVEGVPTQLPETLIKRIVEVSSNPNDLIFDPFAGSGTTLFVSKKLNRNSVGIEINKDYARIAKLRLK